jgi:hypothetical protein
MYDSFFDPKPEDGAAGIFDDRAGAGAGLVDEDSEAEDASDGETPTGFCFRAWPSRE